MSMAVWALGWVLVASPWFYSLFEEPLGPEPGFRTAAAISRAGSTNTSVCLLLGSSTTREGFDDVMMSTSTGLEFVNGGASGGTLLWVELALLMTQRAAVKPYCLVLGLNARMLRPAQSDLHQRGYAPFVDIRDSVAVLDGAPEEWKGVHRGYLWKRTVWPFSAPATILGRRLERALLQRGRPEDFLWPRHLTAPPRFLYNEANSLSVEQWKETWWKMEREGQLDPLAYGAQTERLRLSRILKLAAKISPRVVVVVMPTHSRLRQQLASMQQPFEETLEHARRADIIDAVWGYGDALNDTHFRDFGHLNSGGRHWLSRKVASGVKELWYRP